MLQRRCSLAPSLYQAEKGPRRSLSVELRWPGLKDMRTTLSRALVLHYQRQADAARFPRSFSSHFVTEMQGFSTNNQATLIVLRYPDRTLVIPALRSTG